MGTRRKGNVIIGIAMAAIMIVSVLATAPMVSAESRHTHSNKELLSDFFLCPGVYRNCWMDY